MIDIIQVTKTVSYFTKDEYRESKSDLLPNPSPPFFFPGYLDNNKQLHLLNLQTELPAIQANGIIILQNISDTFPTNLFAQREKANLINWLKDQDANLALYVHQKPVCYYRQANTLSFEIFKLLKEETGHFSLYLNYSGNELTIGIPTRNNHKIAAIKREQPIQYRINGKSDFTLTGRKARTFIEQDFRVEYKGQADTIIFTETVSPLNPLTKPAEYKLVDERKKLN